MVYQNLIKVKKCNKISMRKYKRFLFKINCQKRANILFSKRKILTALFFKDIINCRLMLLYLQKVQI